MRPPRVRRPPRRAVLAPAFAVALLAACDAGGVRFERAPDGASAAGARQGAVDEPPLRAERRPEPPLGPGDARLASTDSAVVLTLRGDSLRMRLGDVLADSIRRTVRQSVDSAAADNAVARMATRLASEVASQVAGGAMAIAVADIRKVTVQGDRLRIETRQGGNFDIASDGKRDGKTEFAPGELARFAEAIEARRRELGAAPR